MILIYHNVIVRSEENPNYMTEQFVFIEIDMITPTFWESVHDRLLSSHTQNWEFLYQVKSPWHLWLKNRKIKRSARVRNEWRYEWLKVLMIDLLLEIDNFLYI